MTNQDTIREQPTIQTILMSFSDPTNNNAGHHNVVFAEKQIQALIADTNKAARDSKDKAYWERNQLVAALSRLYPAWIGYHEGIDWDDYWRTIIYIKLPTGQVSWHIHDSDKPHFYHLDPGLDEWDGHSTEEKYDRLSKLQAESGGDNG